LVETATKDLETARKALPDDPPTAAYHAQQCAEKAVKAAAFELGPFGDAKQFEPIAKSIGHDSTKACLRVIRDFIVKAWRESEFEHDHATYRRMMRRGDRKAAIAYQLGEKYKLAYRMLLQLFDKPAVVLDDKIWQQSLDPLLEPEAQVKKEWEKEADQVHDISDEVWKSLVKALRIDAPRASQLMDRSRGSEEKLAILDEIIEERQGKGLTYQVARLKSAQTKLQRIIGPRTGFEAWLILVISWAAFLDAHEQWGRYYDAAHLEGYKAHVDGAKHLVDKSEEILGLTKDLLESQETLTSH